MEVAAYQLKSELARVCLPAPERDGEKRLAWVNSICAFFLIIGLVGARSHLPVPNHPPPLEQPIPVVLEPVTTPPPTTEVKQVEPQDQDNKEIAPRVVAVTLNTPAINFSVPTIGNLLVPATASPAPPPVELKQQAAPIPQQPQGPATTGDTGDHGDRPRPDIYPRQALDLGQQGTVVLTLTVDDVGAVISVTVKESSGSAILDREARNWVKRKWVQPPINGSHVFQTSIVYKIKNEGE